MRDRSILGEEALSRCGFDALLLLLPSLPLPPPFFNRPLADALPLSLVLSLRSLPISQCTVGKTFKKPRRPFEKERLDAELKLVGEFGLRNKRELWRVQMALSKIRQVRLSECPFYRSVA